MIFSLIFVIIINTSNLNSLNQATAEHQVNHIKETAYTHFGLNQGPDRDRGTYARETCEYYVNKDGRPVLGSLVCQRDMCIPTTTIPPYTCYNLYKITPTKPTGGTILPPPTGLTGEVSPGSEAQPPSIAPGESGQNTKVPKTGILDEPDSLSDDESAEDGDDMEDSNDDEPTINPGK
ncbi:MAG TPA: hypothetical protein VJ599_00195 [Nitrososphaeraceae archaeon]|nr:hypothetical protein [Nitrososphaeraceae archaeon]